jgi:ABC-type Mn2+/Zn2+ transport system permease subunit
MLWLAVGVSVFSALVGAYSSYYFDVATGGTIVLIQGIIFVLVLLYTKLFPQKYR